MQNIFLKTPFRPSSLINEKNDKNCHLPHEVVFWESYVLLTQRKCRCSKTKIFLFAFDILFINIIFLFKIFLI